MGILVCAFVYSIPHREEFPRREEIVQPTAREYLIQPDDRILIVGGTNAFLGASMSYGFGQLVRDEANTIMKNVSCFNGGNLDKSYDLVSLKSKLPALLQHHSPSMIILVLGMRESNSLSKPIPQIRKEIETILVDLTLRNIEVVLCPIDVYANGEATPTESYDADDTIDQLVWLTNRLAKDYGVMQIDLHTAMIDYLRQVNYEELPQSMLTYDGYTLNERGHAFVAQTLMQRLLGLSTVEGASLARAQLAAGGPKAQRISQAPTQPTKLTQFMINNPAAVEFRRVAALKREMRRNDEWEQAQTVSVEVPAL